MPIIISVPTPTPTGEDTASTPTIPHFQFPFTITNQNGKLTANVVEQDSLEEINSCVQAIVSCPIGAWSDQPSFGIPNQLFAGAPLDTNQIQNAILQWEPRASTNITEYPDSSSDAIRHIEIDVSTQQADQ